MTARGLRYEAKVLGLTHYYTGKPCKYGHVSERETDDGRCIECRLASDKERYWANPDKARARVRCYTERNRGLVNAKASSYYWNNVEDMREIAKVRSRLWRKENPGKRNALTKAYRLAKAQRVPAWADLTVIRDIYIKAFETGMTVDHIIPLRGETVSGLHVENNLRLIPMLENVRKSNSFIEELL